MTILFYCEGDDGSMLSHLRNELHSLPSAQVLVDAADLPDDFDRASVTAALVWNPPADFFNGLSSLTHVYALSAGVDKLLSHPGLPADISLIRLQDAGMSEQMAEYVLYGVLHAQRHFHTLGKAQLHAEWLRGLPVKSARDFHVGILGAGVLAVAVAHRLAANGYLVSCWSRTSKTPVEGISMVCGVNALPKLLPTCDALVCLLPLTADTAGILDTALFRQLPRGAFIINCARGEHLVDNDLVSALDEQHLSGALLDVFHQEPLPEQHPFWQHPAIVITPHEAARTLPREAALQIVRSMQQVEQGQTPAGLVDRSRGY